MQQKIGLLGYIMLFATITLPTNAQELVHSRIGDESKGVEGSLKMKNIGKRQQFSAADKATYDTDISSPKSVNVSPDGKTLFVNSLEGCRTVAYSLPDMEKKYTVRYKFDSGEGPLWAPPSGYYNFTHYEGGSKRAFEGKPVESAFSHGGKYLWVPFYRRTFDINAQDPSALAVIDTRSGEIIRMFETGPLPKAVAASPDSKTLAVTHWGNNTVGFLDISGNDPTKWHHLSPITVGHKLDLNYSLTQPVNRDSNSGYLLRGTAFTPDGKYLLVVGLAGPMAVFDVAAHKLIGTVSELHGLRHIAIHDGMVYGSINTQGVALKVPLQAIIDGAKEAQTSGSTQIRVKGNVKRTQVGGGARTLEVSPDGKYLFVACNTASAIYVVDTETMSVVDTIRCDSFPVGLALTPDGKYMAVTSQGRKDIGGGNAVNLFELIRPDMPEIVLPEIGAEDSAVADSAAVDSLANEEGNAAATQLPLNLHGSRPLIWVIILTAIALSSIAIALTMRRRK